MAFYKLNIELLTNMLKLSQIYTLKAISFNFNDGVKATN